MSTTYLDYNATCPIRPAAADAIRNALEVCGNPSSVHRYGRLARRLVEDARERVAALVGAKPAHIVFTPSGSAANNLALRGAGRTRVLTSSIEHDSVRQTPGATALIPVSGDGIADVAALEQALACSTEPTMVSVMLANNETGVIQPIAAIAEIAHRHGALVHCDAIQAVGRIAVNVAALGVDLLSISAHKLGGPQGIGALVVADHVTLEPLVVGGGQERGRQAGTENVPGIAGFGAAAEAVSGLDGSQRIGELRDRLEAGLRAAKRPCRIYGAAAPRVPNTTCVGMTALSSETQVMALDLAGIAVSAGSACSSGKVRASHVLRAMGVSEAEASRAIRVSLGWRSTAADVERFVKAWTALPGHAPVAESSAA